MADTPVKYVGGNKNYATVTISTAVGGLSNIIDIGGLGVRSIEMSSAWTAAVLTFQGAVSTTSRMSSVRHTTAGTETTYTATANRVLNVDPDNFSGLRYIQLRSGTAAASVAQSTSRTLYLGLSAVDETN